jgi:hypothetical protein
MLPFPTWGVGDGVMFFRAEQVNKEFSYLQELSLSLHFPSAFLILLSFHLILSSASRPLFFPHDFFYSPLLLPVLIFVRLILYAYVFFIFLVSCFSFIPFLFCFSLFYFLVLFYFLFVHLILLFPRPHHLLFLTLILPLSSCSSTSTTSLTPASVRSRPETRCGRLSLPLRHGLPSRTNFSPKDNWGYHINENYVRMGELRVAYKILSGNPKE